MAAIESVGLVKSLGGSRVVNGIDLLVPAASVYGFLGPNGSGKTTTIRMILGLIAPSGGRLSVLGNLMPHARLKAARSMGSLVETPSLYDHLTGEENLDIARRVLDLPQTEISRTLALTGLSGAARRRAGTYSLGMRQRLGLARALLGAPKLLVLDEPTNGLDPHGIIEMRDLIRDLPARGGVTVFVSSHLLNEVQQMAAHAGLIHEGRMLAQGPLDSLLDAADTDLEVTVAEAPRAAQVLAAMDYRARATGPNTLIVMELRGRPNAAAAINRALIDAGFAVSRLVFRTVTLEDLFLKLTARHGASVRVAA
jgi:lantibiotic transport system ATP-binding protein